MTPKEKAKELVDNFMNLKPPKLSDYSQIYLPTAKLCALKVVEEIVKEVLEFQYDETTAPHRIYWRKVELEIKKL